MRFAKPETRIMDGTAPQTSLSAALDEVRRADGALARDAALGVFRRHVAQAQYQVRDAFETHRLAGVAAAGRLAALADEEVRALFALAAEAITGRAMLD